jgi:anthranilate phosphoribosyltransferase
MSGSDWTSIIKEVGRGAHGARNLPEAEAERLFGAMLDGKVPDLELGAIWIAYRIKGESLGELLGFCRAVMARMPRLLAPAGPLPVILPSYNGARRLPNMTPLLALMLAREGVPVLVHGIATAYGRVTTAAILEAMGIAPCADAGQASARLKSEHLAYLPLEALSPGLSNLMNGRARIGVRSSAHTVAKLLDPFDGLALRVVPVTHPDYVRRMGEFLSAAATPAVLLRGSEGEPYASSKRMPALQGFLRGEARELVAQGESEPVTEGMPDAIDAESTANWTREVLAGKRPVPLPLRRQVDCLSATARQ